MIPLKRGKLILLVSSTKVLWTLGTMLCIPFLPQFLWVGIKQRTCARVHEHTAERVTGISAANPHTDFVAVPPLSPLVHTEYVDNFVGLSQQEGVARDAAERVSDALVEDGLPVHPVICSREE